MVSCTGHHFFAPTFFDTTSTFITLHLEFDGSILFFLKDYKPNQDFELFFYSFKLTFQRMSHLLTSGHSRMVFEHLWNYFHPEDLVNGFPHLFQLCFYIAQGHIPPQITHVLGATHLLTMTKLLGGIHPIAMGEVSYRFTSYTLCFQFNDTFVTHFSPHQFRVTTKSNCERIIHGIKCTLDLHFDLGCFQVRFGKRLQFGVKKGHISKTSYSKWKHHTSHPLCLCILCI